MAATIELHFWFIDGKEGEFLLKTKKIFGISFQLPFKLKKQRSVTPCKR